jgi:hypothetical protein
VDPGVGLDDVGKTSWPYQDLKSDPSTVLSIASRYTDCCIPVLS